MPLQLKNAQSQSIRAQDGLYISCAAALIRPVPPPNRKVSKVRRPIPFPLSPPANHTRCSRVLYFGFNVTDHFMCEYLRSRLGEFILDYEVAELHLVQATLLCLTRETGIRTLGFHTAQPEHSSSGVMTWDNPPRVPIITICSNRADDFQQRPTQKQMDHITKLLDTDPRWWKDSLYPNDFE